MAQVRKMNNGGSVQKLKYGSIIKNGTKYEMDEESMKRLEQHIAAADPDIQQSLADDWNLLRSGQDVIIDTFSNQRSTKPSDFSEGQMRRLGKDKPTESKWHGRFNTDIHKYNKATQYLGKFDPSKVEVKEETSKTKLGPGSSKFEYITNDDGTRSYRSLPNTDEMKLFDDIAAYLDGDEAYRIGYDVSGWADFNDLETWYKGLDNPDFLKNLRIKILNGQELDANETDYLNAIGLGFDVASNKKIEEQKADAELKAIQDKAWADFNIGNLWNNSLRGNQFYYDSNSDTYKLNSEFMPLGLPTETRGFYFNEDFVKNNPGYDWLLGKVYFNGKWYNESELSNSASRLYAMLNSLKYYDKNKSGDQAGANSILTTYWGDLMIPSMSSETSNYFGNFYQNPNYRYIPLNYNKRGATYKGYNIPENYSVVKRMDLTENNIDSIGRRKESYIMLDPYGNVINSIDGLGPIQDALNYEDFVGLNNAPTKIEHVSRVSTDKNDKYFYNRYLEDKGLIKGYVDPSDKNTVHVSVDKSLGGDGKNVFLNMPRNVYEAISDVDFLKNLESNPSLKAEFIKLVQGNFSSLPSVTGSTIRSNINSAELEKLGLKNAQDVINWFVQYSSNRQYTTRPSLKKGGILKGKEGTEMYYEPELEPAIVIAERTPKIIQKPSPSARFYSLYTKPSISKLPERKSYLDSKSSKFAVYKAMNTEEPEVVTNAREQISKLVDSEEYQRISLSNPDIANTILNTQIDNILAGVNDETIREKLSTELDSFRQHETFKSGGILKGEEGIPSLPKLDDIVIDDIEIPDYNIPFKTLDFNRNVDLMGSYRQAKRHAKKFAKNNPGYDHFTWQGKQYGLNGKPYDPLHGSHPVDGKEFSMMPEAVNQTLSLGRLGWDIGTNNKLYDIQSKGLIESSNAKMASMPQEIYSRQTINAGNAERELGKRKLQTLPPVNSDYIKYAAMKRAADDAASIHFANATLADSQQHSENLSKQIEEQRMYANMRNQIEAHNKGIQAAKMVGLSELAAARTQANRQSFANYLLEKQTEFDQNRGKMENAVLAENRLKWQEEAEAGFQKDLEDKFRILYDKSGEKDQYTLNQWIYNNYNPDFVKLQKLWRQYVTDKELAFTKSQIPGKWMFKSGGSLRSTGDQIKINKHKAFDQNWVNNNKAVRRAIEKLNDRAYNILMKILSDEI